MEIFEATPFDITQLSKLFNEYRMFYKQPSGIDVAKEFLEERMKLKQSIIYIAYDNDIAVGFVQLYPIFSSVQLKRLWLLNDLYVREEYRKNGVASLLIEKCKDLIKSDESAGILLETSSDNESANKLYVKEGFIKTSNHFYYWSDKS